MTGYHAVSSPGTVSARTRAGSDSDQYRSDAAQGRAGSAKSPEGTVLFVHVPKTAGSTLNWILRWQYRRDERCVLRRIFTRLDLPLEEYANLLPERREKLRIISAHMAFGLHDHIPGATTYVSILREPAARVVSAYYHMRRQRSHPLHEQATALDLPQFLASGVYLDGDNGQVRRLSGVGDAVGFGECGQDALELALRNVHDHFAFVGLTERFDESLLILREKLGWTLPFYLRQNTGRNRPHDAALPAQVRRAVERHNELDSALYAHVQALVAQEVAHRGPAFSRLVRRFRFLNSTYFPVYSFPQRVADKVRMERRKRRSSGAAVHVAR